MKKSLLIDLDIITVGIWDRRGTNTDIANKFIERIKKKEFFVVTPFYLLETVLKWRYDELKNDIKEFYLMYSDKLLNDTDIREHILKEKIDPNVILLKFKRIGIKDEDGLLIFVASIFKLDYLVTFNRKHLRNRKTEINTILKECGLNEIDIIGPDEI